MDSKSLHAECCGVMGYTEVHHIISTSVPIDLGGPLTAAMSECDMVLLTKLKDVQQHEPASFWGTK